MANYNHIMNLRYKGTSVFITTPSSSTIIPAAFDNIENLKEVNAFGTKLIPISYVPTGKHGIIFTYTDPNPCIIAATGILVPVSDGVYNFQKTEVQLNIPSFDFSELPAFDIDFDNQEPAKEEAIPLTGEEGETLFGTD